MTKPARYTGGEWNGVRKPWDSVGLRVCIAYADTYDVGAVRPSLNSLYQALNQSPSILAERVFAPLPDFASMMRSDGLPLSSLESGRPAGDFDVLAIGIPSELAATTVLEMLDLARMPQRAAHRTASDPVVIGWEEKPINPEPMADFFDAFLIGDPEVAFLGVIRAWGDLPGGIGRPPARDDLLRRLAMEPGVYVPSLYIERHGAGGAFQQLQPLGGAPSRVERVSWGDMRPIPSRPVVPYLQTLPDRAVVEVQRGCGLGCATVLAGLGSPPLRERAQDDVVTAIQETLKNTGYEEVALAATCFRDYRNREQLVSSVQEMCAKLKATLRLPPLPLDLLTPSLMESLEKGNGVGPLTLGPQVANAALSEAVLGEGSLAEPLALLHEGATEGAFKNLRVEVVVGHPTSPQGGWEAAAALARALRHSVGPQARIRIDASVFVRRPFTVWQWAPQASLAPLEEEMRSLGHAIGRRVGHLVEGNPGKAIVEAALAGGDRRLGGIIHQAWRGGSVLDLADGQFQVEPWRRAFDDAGIDLGTYAGRARDIGEPLPWEHIGGPERATLARLFQEQGAAAHTSET